MRKLGIKIEGLKDAGDGNKTTDVHSNQGFQKVVLLKMEYVFLLNRDRYYSLIATQL